MLPETECRVNKFREKVEKSKRNGWRHSVFSAHNYPKDRYVGFWKDDKREGNGIEISRHGFLYKGEWVEGAKQGFGILSKIRKKDHSEKLYSGYWCRGRKHGFGVHWYPDSFYKGCFVKGKKHGYGRMWWYNGKHYEGFWEDDLFHGQGILTLCDGNQYEGEFVRGRKEGRGKFYHKNTGQTQEGYWKDDSCISSTMKDSHFRQHAKRPTSYPIPKISWKSNE